MYRSWSIDGRREALVPQASPSEVVLVAMGDLMLAGEWDQRASRGQIDGALEELASLCKGADIVFANLEVTLPGHNGVILKQPQVLGRASTIAQSLETLRVDLVNLSNNHSFDAYFEGFQRVRRLLDSRGILSFGAGGNAAEAGLAAVFRRRGILFGWLGYTALDTRPSHVAGMDCFGVNPLVEEVACSDVRKLKEAVDHVIVSLHWGIEYCHLPAPSQVRLGRSLIEQGASLVLGHHAHVIQGIESYAGGCIAYNLGNAATTDLTIGSRLAIRQTRRTRSSVILRVVFSKEHLETVESFPMRSHRGILHVGDRYARRILEAANRQLAAGVTSYGWRARRLYEDLLVRTLRKLHPRVIRSVRLRHVITFINNFVRAIRGEEAA